MHNTLLTDRYIRGLRTSDLVSYKALRGLVLLLMAAFVYTPIQVAHAASKTSSLDGLGVPIGPDSQALTTARGHDVIVVVAYGGSGLYVMDSAGLRFTQRVSSWISPCGRGDCLLYLSEFYAVADRPLRSDNITAVVPLNSYYDGFALVGLQAVAIHGASMGIFDADPSIPIIGCQRPFLCSRHILQLSIQTSTSDFVVAATAIDGDSGGCFTEPGFTTVQTIMNPVDLGFEFYYRIVPVPNTTVNLACPPYNSVAMFQMDAVSLVPSQS